MFQVLFKVYSISDSAGEEYFYLFKISFMRRIQAIAIFVLLAFSAIFADSALRFADDQMMQKHHHHKTDPNADPITVHLVPHSHDDVGWLKTVDDYYYGGRQDIQWAGVQYTIDTVVEQLISNPSYKFTIVEVAFLYRWWNQSTTQQKENMKKLLQNGQLVLINGGWCMSDEATPYYEDFIDQMTIGLRWLKETFDYVPEVAWHIDPFGHQAAAASMFSEMGFQAFFFSRIDYQDKELRLSKKAMEMIWRPEQYVPDPKQYIFTHVNYYHYSPPPGFCFDQLCKNQPIKDDKTMEDFNIDIKSKELVAYFKSMALHFRTTTLMHTLGEDFHFSNARMWYKNFDKLIKYINVRPELGVKLMYSTPTDYIHALHQNHSSTVFPTKTDDFFPYADQQHAYWTGYFVSRTAIKGFVRDFGRYLQAARKHIAELKIAGSSEEVKAHSEHIQKAIWGMEMAMGILQHHDAVAGTEKQRVADDYIATALASLYVFEPIYKQIKIEQIKNEISEDISSENIHFNIFWNNSAKLTGIDQMVSANKTVLLNLYNPGAKGTYSMKIRVPQHNFNVHSPKLANIQGDVICDNLTSSSDCELMFDLDMEASSNNYVKLVPTKTSGSANIVKLKSLSALDPKETFKITDTVSLSISKTLQKFDLEINGINETFAIGYSYYDSYQGEGQKSGAYIFRPANNTPKTFSNTKTWYYAIGTKVVIVVLEGDKSQTKVTFSKRKDYIESYGFEIESFIDSIPISDHQGKEVIMTYTANYVNNGIFYTDSNGLEEQERKLNYRPTWPLIVNEAVSGNYYPINSHISIIDKTIPDKPRRLTIVTDRSQGGSVIRDGVIEIMLNRRTTKDDSRGVDEPLNEEQPDKRGLTQSMRHWVVFGDQYREVQRRNDQKIMVTIAQSATSSFSPTVKIRPGPISVPENVKLFLRPFMDGSYLVRFHNMDSKNENTVNLDGWDFVEMTLSANQLKEDWIKNQFIWKEEPQSVENQKELSFLEKVKSMFGEVKSEIDMASNNFKAKSDPNAIVLKPFKIRTFKMIKSQ